MFSSISLAFLRFNGPLFKSLSKRLSFKETLIGARQKGDSKWEKPVSAQKSAVSCENLRFPAVFCANLRLPNPLIYRASRKSARKAAKICENVRSGSGFSLLLSPFWRALISKSLHHNTPLVAMKGWRSKTKCQIRGWTLPPNLNYHSNRNVYQTNSPEFEVGNGKNCRHPKNPQYF